MTTRIMSVMAIPRGEYQKLRNEAKLLIPIEHQTGNIVIKDPFRSA